MNASENDNGRPFVERDNMNLNIGGVKFDAGKIRLDLVPPESELAQAAVYTYGAIKYDDWNWAKGMRKGRLVAALKRHTNFYLLGEEFDDESGLPHTWHMHCCTGMLIGVELRGVAEEDRAVSTNALYAVRSIFARMRDPHGTVKNGGGTLVQNHWADDIVDTPEEKAVLEHVVDKGHDPEELFDWMLDSDRFPSKARVAFNKARNPEEPAVFTKEFWEMTIPERVDVLSTEPEDTRVSKERLTMGLARVEVEFLREVRDGHKISATGALHTALKENLGGHGYIYSDGHYLRLTSLGKKILAEIDIKYNEDRAFNSFYSDAGSQ